MDKVIGDIAGVPNPKSDWGQNDERKADYIKNKPDLTVFANALKGTTSGEAIGITDISPIEHNMTIKVSGIEDISTVKLYKQGKNLVNFFDINTQEDIKYIDNKDTNVSAKGYALRNLKVGESYTITYSFKDNTQLCTYFVLGRIDKYTRKLISYTYLAQTVENPGLISPYTFTVQDGVEYGLFRATGVQISQNSLDRFSVFQVEIGSATEYEPYIEPTIYDVSADGIVEGVTSLYPNTTLYTDTSGAVIDVEYDRDINKAFAELQNAIIAIGGLE
jgi:hypothetical protein